MRICVVKKTGRIVGMMDPCAPGTLVKNAVTDGYKKAEVEEREVSKAEYQKLMASQPKTDEEWNAGIIRQIESLERTQARALREAALGKPERLKAIDKEIASLRSQFKK